MTVPDTNVKKTKLNEEKKKVTEVGCVISVIVFHKTHRNKNTFMNKACEQYSMDKSQRF